MENFLRKYGWTFVLALIAISASVLALTANNLVASQLAPHTVPEMPEMNTDQQPAERRAPTQNKNWDRTIADLCLFGCPEAEPVDECAGECGPDEVCEGGQCVPVEEEAPQEDSDLPALSELNIKLMGAMVADRDEYSMALMRDDESSETLVVSPGDYIAEDAELIEIRRDRVIIKRDGNFEYIRLDKSIGGEPSAMPTSTQKRSRVRSSNSTRSASSATKESNSSKESSSSNEAVKKVDDDEFQVQRSAIEEQVQDKQALARQGRVVPNYKDGKRDGLKLVGISPNSVYSQLGIQSGDVIHSVNGKEIKTSQQAMELFDKMQSEREVSVEVERRGQKRRMQYQIR